MSTNTTQYLCDAWLVEEECITEDNCHSLPAETLFLIDIYGYTARYNPEEDAGNYEEEVAAEVPMTVKRLPLRKSELMSNNNCWSLMVTTLLEMNIPANAHPIIIQKIHECARCDHHSTANRVVPMIVQVRTARPSRILFHGEPVSGPGSRGTSSKACIERALEKVQVQVQAEGCSRQCVICLEEMLAGTEAARMPCSHVYHESCIKNWLDKSNACPLCRFQMPTTS